MGREETTKKKSITIIPCRLSMCKNMETRWVSFSCLIGWLVSSGEKKRQTCEGGKSSPKVVRNNLG
jgi:hypothetical protein